MQIGFNVTAPAQAVKLLIYTRAFRLIKSVDLGACPEGFVVKPVNRSYLKDLSAGLYLYVVKQSGVSGKETKSRIKMFVIIR